MIRNMPRSLLFILLTASAAVLMHAPLLAQSTASGDARNQNFVRQFIGRDSCALNTCHGGPISGKVDWTSSLTAFEAYDPHARAGLVLSNELSEQIIQALEPDAKKSSRIRNTILIERCATCHAPGLASLPNAQRDQKEKLQMHFLDGVSCESCHGAAKDWLEPHKRIDFSVSAGLRLGMRDTETYLDRIAACTRCHIGSRTEDGLIRDMNHDMIAAGHPPLRFDGWTYDQLLPPHWDHDAQVHDGVNSSAGHHNLKRFRLGKLVGLREAATLTQERIAALNENSLNKSVWPEFSDFDCFACHQRLRAHKIEDITSRPLSHRLVDPRYNPFLATGIDGLWKAVDFKTANVNDRKRDIDKFRLRAIEALGAATQPDAIRFKEYAQNLIQLENRTTYHPPVMDFFSATRVNASAALFVADTIDRQLDWYDAAVWLLQIQASLLDNPELLDSRGRSKFESLITRLQFSRETAAGRSMMYESPADFDIESFIKEAEVLSALLKASQR